MAALQRGRRALGRLRRDLVTVSATLLVAIGLSAGCKPKDVSLAPPAGTPAMEPAHAAYFDDGITVTPVILVGRAPSDVVDQRLFGERLGHADLIAEVTIEDLWERRRGAKVQRFVEVRIQEPLLRELPKRSAETQRLEVVSIDPLPGELRGQRFILFVRWSPSERPSFKHHLMIADDATVEVIRSMVAHAKESGYLDKGGKKRTRRSKEKGAKKDRKKDR